MATGTYLLLAAAGALVAVLVLLLRRERRRSRLLVAAEERRLTQIGDLERATREAETAEGRARADEERQRRELRALARDRETAREWLQRLRRELAEAQARAGTIGDPGDPYELVLRTALALLEAEKGLLLARGDEDADGDLDLVCAVGFEHDATNSRVVQELASRTLVEEETLRIDDVSELADGAPTDADRELANLVAIPVYIFDRFHGALVAANRDGGFHEFDDEVLLALGDHAGAALHNARLHGRLRNAYVATVRVLADAIEAKDPFLRGHSDQVSDLVAGVARSLELGPKEREELVFASLLHDVGKIGISERILLKPARLTAEEYAVVQLHPRIGYRLVDQVPDLRPIGLAILHHHERFDGGGYPAGLRGEQIPRAARLIAIADAFSAMTSERPYGERMSAEDACEELKRCAGTQFDPELVRLFCDEVDRRGESIDEPGALDRALDDPELQQHRAGGQGVLGLTALAATDGTTLVYSHSHLYREARALASSAALNGRPFGVIVAELTELAEINSADGFTAGDCALRNVATEADRLAARVGGIAGRLSGRRLAVVVPGAGEAEARSLAEELQPDASIVVRCAAWAPGDTGDDVVARARADTRTLSR